MNRTAAPVPRASRVYVIAQLTGWAIYAAFGVLFTRIFNGLNAGVASAVIVGCTLGALGSHQIRRTSHANRWWDLPVSALIPRLAGAAIVTAIAVELLVWAYGLFVVHVYTISSSTPGVMVVTTFNWAFIMLLWTALYAGVTFFQRYRHAEIRRLQLEVAARDAQLQTLHAQIHPHFLFNSLNSLRALIAEDPARARDLVSGLAELMRYALQAGRREQVPLAEEMAVVEGYLQLEGARFEDRLRWSLDVPQDCRALMLPPMMLQTLVENAVKHGVAMREEGGDVQVFARLAAQRLELVVRNPGRLGPAREGGIGLANVRERLRLRHGAHASVTLTQASEDVVETLLVLPVVGER
jgi:hypothetical protein